MARIRSIHPGIFTDESFMSASAHARLLIIGIWTEAFDDGVFEWKPLTLKARIFPVDAVDVAGLLEELSALGFIKRFETAGKAYGAIRNFQRFQRPKKPNSSGALPDQLTDYVGASGTCSEPVRNQFGTSTENPPQMEDGGDNREDNIIPQLSPLPADGGGKKTPKGSRLHADWHPSADEINEAIRIGLTFDQATAEAEKFRDYWTAKAGRDAVKLDWLATWRNWCRNAKARGSPRGAASRPGYDPRFDTRSGQYDPVLHAKVRSW